VRKSAKAVSKPMTSDGISRRFKMLTHDLRTAIGGITGNLGLVDEQELSGDNRERILAAQASAQLLTHFLSDLESSISGEVDTAPALDPEIIQTRSFQDTLLRQWNGLAAAKGLELKASCTANVPETARLDSYRLSRIIGNIIQNAIKYAKQGTIELALASPEPGVLTITVSDDGPGFSKEARELLFSFSGRPRGTAQSGSGLGLFIAKNLTDQLSGTIDAFNRPEGGASVVLSIPVEQKAAAASMAIMPNAALPDLSGLRVLLVEDNVTNQVVVSQMLEAMGAEFSLASDGLEGLQALESANFDLALIDIEMPRLSGLDLIRKIRERSDEKAKMALVAFTAYAMREHRERINSAGADGLIAKPVTGIQELGRAILRYSPKSADQSTQQADYKNPQNAQPGPPSQTVDKHVFDGLLATIGKDTMTELLVRVDSDLQDVSAKVSTALETHDWGLTRQASHVLISVAGAIGATELQHRAQRLNTHCHGNNSEVIVSASKQCLAGILDLQNFVRNKTI